MRVNNTIVRDLEGLKAAKNNSLDGVVRKVAEIYDGVRRSVRAVVAKHQVLEALGSQHFRKVLIKAHSIKQAIGTERADGAVCRAVGKCIAVAAGVGANQAVETDRAADDEVVAARTGEGVVA